MVRNKFCILSAGLFFAMASAAQATVGCSVISDVAGVEYVDLYSEPDDSAAITREIPLGDLVLYPADDLAPQELEGWVWVRHDATQESIWQSGEYGWMKSENISDCG